MPQEKSKKKAVLIPVLTIIVILCIATFHDLNTEMNFAFHEDSGEEQGNLILERKASYEIIWEFKSTNTMKVLIIKKSSLEWYKRVVSEIAEEYHIDTSYYWNEFLESHYVSQGKYEDSGKFKSTDNTLYYIEFVTSGTFTYHVNWDPFAIDLKWIFFTLLGIFTTIGIFSYIFRFNYLIKIKRNIKKYNSLKAPTLDNCAYIITYKCEICGINLDLDAIFCHKCGSRLNKYK
ncbi:MAG: hypothetical protein ACFE9Q_07510 [Candidatus Hodarchaeota archaeon]